MFCGGKGINLILHQRQKGQKYEEKVNVAKSGDNISQPSPQTAVRATVKLVVVMITPRKTEPGESLTRPGGDEEHKEKNQIPGPALVCLRPPQ